jgi:ADP-ribosylglycohydrolase
MDINKVAGVIYGLAIGDALGRLTEFKSLSRIKSKYGDTGITDLPEPALYTDDTRMTVSL